MIENQGTTTNLFEKINSLLKGAENRKDFDREALQQKMVDLGIRGLTQYNIGWLIGAKENRMTGLYNHIRYIYVYEEIALEVLHELYRDGMDFDEVRKMVAEETLRRMGFLEFDAVEIEGVEDVSLGRVNRLIDIIREELKRGEVSLVGYLRKKPLRDEIIDSRVESLEGLLLSLKKVGKECDSKIDKLIVAYCDNFKLLITRCLKVVDRSKMGDIDITLLIDELLLDYPELVGCFVDGKLKGLSSRMFKDVAIVNTYFSRDGLEEVLSDDNIMKTLREEGLEMEEGEMREIFTRRRRLLLAVKNIANLLQGFKSLGRNLKEVLTDENIMKALKEEGLEMEEEEMREIFTRARRFMLALGNRANPLEGVKKVGKNVKEVLTDENIMKGLKEEGLEMEEKEMLEIFTRVIRLELAINNRANPIGAIKKVGKNVKEVLTDENIMKALKEEGLEMEEEEMREIFTRGRRLELAIYNRANPLEGVKKLGRNVKEVLTDENIMKALKEEGLEMEEKEMLEVFTRGRRLELAINNRANPLEGVKKVGKNVKEVLTDKNIMKALKEEGLEMEEKEMLEIFTRVIRLELAINNRANPIGAIKKVGKNVKEVLTDENIMKGLKEEGLEMEEEEMLEIFTRATRLELAIKNIANPIGAIKKVGKNVKEVLTDKNIMKALKEEGLEMEEEEMEEIFSRGLRLFLAINNRANPLHGALNYFKGDLKYGRSYFKESHPGLYRKYFE